MSQAAGTVSRRRRKTQGTTRSARMTRAARSDGASPYQILWRSMPESKLHTPERDPGREFFLVNHAKETNHRTCAAR
jgi:hypothetical protein